jgi:hypothetical protein
VFEGPIYAAAVSPLFRPVQMLLPIFAGWVNRHQLDVIEYLQAENACSTSAWVGGRSPNLNSYAEGFVYRKSASVG